MAFLVWVMVGLAIWHFTVYLPDHFWGGIAGAFVGAIIGSLLGGLIISGFTPPSRDDVDLVTFFEGVPGTIVGMAVVYVRGLQLERADTDPHTLTKAV